MVFTEPTLTSIVAKNLLNDWISDSQTLDYWLDTFSAAEKATFMGEVKKTTFDQPIHVMEKAKKISTPLKKRVRDLLDEEEPWNFLGLDSSLLLKEQLSLIETALKENQKKHENFQQCHLELEDAIRAASYAYEYGSENLHLPVGKNRNC